MSEKGKYLQQIAKDIEWCKAQIQSLKHDIKSCPQHKEAELKEKLDKISQQITKHEDKHGIRQRKWDKAKTSPRKNTAGSPMNTNTTPRMYTEDQKSARSQLKTTDGKAKGRMKQNQQMNVEMMDRNDLERAMEEEKDDQGKLDLNTATAAAVAGAGLSM